MSWKFWEKYRNHLSVPTIDSETAAQTGDAACPLVASGDKLPGLLQTEETGFQVQTGSQRLRLHPCESCGACCAFFLVSFPGSESDDIAGGLVPHGMSGRCGDTRRFMHGTETRHPRCVALQGVVGSSVSCSIYENRPTICRSFSRSWENNSGNMLCDRARAVFGLQPFSQY